MSTPEKPASTGDVLLFKNVTVRQAFPFMVLVMVWYIATSMLQDERDLALLTASMILSAIIPPLLKEFEARSKK